MSVWREELDFIIDLARDAGEIAMRYFRTDVKTEFKTGDEPVTEADRIVNERIVRSLRQRFPSDAVLAEESPPDPRRFDVDRTWMVDPIDGTREFIEGTDGWGVLIGLAERGRPVLGITYQPTNRTLIEAAAGHGTFLTNPEGRRRLYRRPGSLANRPVIGVSSRHLRPLTLEIAKALNASEIHTSGGFGGRAALAADGQVDVVLHAGGRPKEWDSCALQIILEEAGLVMVDCLGEPLAYLQEDPVQPNGVLIAPRDLIDQVTAIVAPLYRNHLAGRTSP